MELEFESLQVPERYAVLSIDLEDWYFLRHRHLTGRDTEVHHEVIEQTLAWLHWMKSCGIRGTFFCLGVVAKKFPDLILEVYRQGHEVASHGYSHRLTKDLTQAEFEYDIKKSLETLEDLVGEKIFGYRAPQFWIRHPDFSPLRILAECGLKYDSSVFPMRLRGYGWSDFPRSATRIHWSDGLSLVEFPLGTSPLCGVHLPVSGGGYFRILPTTILKKLMRSIEANPIMLYFHPYEVSAQTLRLSKMGLRTGYFKRLRLEGPQNLGRGPGLLKKLEAIGNRFCYRSAKEVIHEIESRLEGEGRRALL